jgi:hypothetical protein
MAYFQQDEKKVTWEQSYGAIAAEKWRCSESSISDWATK